MNTTAKLEKPPVEIDIKIHNQSFKIKYPNSGQNIDIATLIAKLSDNQYNNLLYQNSPHAGYSIKVINTYCFLTIMLPELRKNLNVDSLLDISVEDSLVLINVYDEQIVPWMEKWTEYINQKIEELKTGEPVKSKLV